MSFRDHKFVEAIELMQRTESLHKSATPAGCKHRRRARRVEIRLPVDIKLAADSGSPWIVAQMRDISARGIRLRVDRAIAADNLFLLRLPTKDGGKTAVPLICRVAHCVPDKDFFMIGAEFSGYATPEESVSESAEQLERIRRSILD